MEELQEKMVAAPKTRGSSAQSWTHSSVAGAGSSVGTAVRERLASLATPIARPRATVPTTAHHTRTRTHCKSGGR